ncbi:MAG: ABC transporter permease [Anaerolineaceae bacterium]|nr:ABC transporter permease [Anaerolineaceae bacterium]
MDAALLTTLTTWLAMSIRMSVPLLFPSLGGLLAQKAGVYNFGLEGMMLCGAFFGYWVSNKTGSPWLGLLAAIISGALLALLLAFTSIRLRVSQLVIGLGIGIFSLGFTGYLFRLVPSEAGGVAPAAPLFPKVNFGALRGIPFIGDTFLSHDWMVYAAYGFAAIIAWFFYRTTAGLNFRAVGENPQVADTAGINVILYRYLAVIISGALAAMGGAYLTLTQTAYFTENITAGRGWIAISAIILGKFNPWGVLLACLLFGAADSGQMHLQFMEVGIPYQFLLMVPYIMAIIAMTGVVGKVRSPAAMGKPYAKH